VFGAVNETLLVGGGETLPRRTAGWHARYQESLARFPDPARKLWKQKGTGRARVGSIRSPLWRHGGTVHGPQPRSYDYTFPRKKIAGCVAPPRWRRSLQTANSSS